jgi:hypothetical protein
MPRGSRNPVTVRRETEAAHRALRKLRAKSSIMAPISFERPVPQMQELAQETSGPIIAVRCPALPIRHSVSDLSPASGKAALTTLRPLMGNAVPQSLCLSSVARQMAACAPADSRLRSRIRASSQSRCWHGEGAALQLVLRPLGRRRSTGELCDDAV